MFNEATLIGHVGQDPEIRTTKNDTKVANFSVATSKKIKDQTVTEWHRVTAWGKLADIVESYVRKGSLVFVRGEIQTRKWQDQSGGDKYSTEIQLGSFSSVLRVLNGGSGEDGKPNAKPEPDDDIPFDNPEDPFVL